jgi:hypothetical protein
MGAALSPTSRVRLSRSQPMKNTLDCALIRAWRSTPK